jgi:hypothetical protein
MPRKKMHEAKMLQYVIKTRVNKQRYDYLNEMLTRSPHSSMSEMVREIICNKPIKYQVHDASFEKYMEVLSGVQKELKAIGVNINQVTRYFNSTRNDSQRVFYSLKIAEQYKEVELKVEQLFPIIAELAKKWLQK